MSRKILYVDDESINIELFKASFRNDYKIFTALSASIGLEILEQDPNIELIISDLKMPHMDGLEFFRVIKSRYQGKICILLTGYLEPEIMLEGFNKELIFRYVMKPWRKNDLAAIIEETFKRINHR